MKLKFLDPTDVTTLVNKSTGKHIIANGLEVIPVYKGKTYSVKDIVNKDGTVNVRKAKQIMEEVAEYFGGKKMQNRAENPKYHKDDPNTWLHTKKVAKNAWNIPVPSGYTKQDQMIAALGHDFGKILSRDGHAEVSYNLIKQIFPDAAEKQLNAIRKHMDPLEEIADQLELGTHFADLGVVPEADLSKLGLSQKELDIVNKTKWFKSGGNLITKASSGMILNLFRKSFPGKTYKTLTSEDWDKAYTYVLNRYNQKPSNVLQRIRDYHFVTKAPDTVVKKTNGAPLEVYHGGTSPSIDVFDLNAPTNASLTNTLDRKVYFSKDRGVAKQYAVDPEYKKALTIDHILEGFGFDEDGVEYAARALKISKKEVIDLIEKYKIGLDFVTRKTKEGDFIYPVYLNMRKHTIQDAAGGDITHLTKAQRKAINENPGAIVTNVDETVTNQYGMRTPPTTDYLVQYPQQIKRSAAITYDSNGNVIPISQRDNFYNPNINYKVGGKLIKKSNKNVNK